jgi:hypothetical protein
MRQGPRKRESLEFPDPELRQLYERATCEQWQVEQLDWAALALERIAPPTRVPLTALYTDVAFAKAIGVRTLQQVTEQVPAGFLRAFALTQLADVRQHVRFFSVVAEQLGAPETVSPFLMQLSDDLRTVPKPDELLLHLHLIALTIQALFVANSERALASLSAGPRPLPRALPAWESVLALLRCVVERVGRDEARHIAFGSRYLQDRIAACGPAERHTLGQRASVSAALLYRAFELRSDAFQGLVLHPHALLQHAFSQVQRELTLLGIELALPSARSR